MKQNFEVNFLDKALSFIESLEKNVRTKIEYNIKLASLSNDPELLKKLTSDIWEFRTKYKNRQYRLLAFWDKDRKSFIICTHGFVKKTQKTPKNEIEKAKKYKQDYLRRST